MTIQAVDLTIDPSGETVSRDLEQAMQHAPAGSVNGAATPSRQNQIKYVPTGTGAAYWGPGSLMTFIITGKETGGAFFLAEMSVPPGGGPPPHIHHREDESFHVLEGTLTVRVGEHTITASPGILLSFPAESLTPSKTAAMVL
jgi:mannose-6-phosphate isomerase-like protein (cupin superfamily)